MDADALAKDFYRAVMDTSRYSVRSQQAAEFKVGVSDLGFCSERTRRMLAQETPAETDVLTAWIGTALGDYAEQAAMQRWPEAIRQAEVSIVLHGEERDFTLTGHPDLIIPEENLVIDFKTGYGLTSVRRSGPSLQQQFQRHCYAKAAWNGGYFGSIPLSEVSVANVWIDRAGIDKEVHVQMEPFDQGFVDHAGQWLDDVVYAYVHQEEARKEPPRDMCAVVCGFYEPCRGGDTDVQGLIVDRPTLNAVDMYREGLALEKQGRKLKDEAKVHLTGIRGSTGQFMIRWTHVNETHVPESTRSAYDKLEVRAVPKPKVAK